MILISFLLMVVKTATLNILLCTTIQILKDFLAHPFHRYGNKLMREVNAEHAYNKDFGILS